MSEAKTVQRWRWAHALYIMCGTIAAFSTAVFLACSVVDMFPRTEGVLAFFSACVLGMSMLLGIGGVFCIVILGGTYWWDVMMRGYGVLTREKIYNNGYPHRPKNLWLLTFIMYGLMALACEDCLGTEGMAVVMGILTAACDVLVIAMITCELKVMFCQYVQADRE